MKATTVSQTPPADRSDRSEAPRPEAEGAEAPVVIDEATISAAVEAALAAVADADTTAELKAVRIEHTGDASVIARANRGIKALAPAERAHAGKLLGQAKGEVNAAIGRRQAALAAAEEEAALERETVDVTLPTDRRPRGARHPLTTLADRIADFFVGMGWQIAEGPVVEAEWFNFDALNADADHPSRSLQDTLYVAPTGSGALLRTQTSPVQIRAMLERGAPLYIACPGTVYRADEMDATHSPMFTQVEGLAIDRGLTMANLVGTLDAVAQHFFGPEVVTRLRPNHFPFTEPSAEMDFRCFACDARLGLDHAPDPDCRVCGGTGWIEMGGCGMVHPQVLRSAGIDPEENQGFAFGLGIERILMLLSGVGDMHDIVEGDVRFSQHYGTEI